MKRESRREHNPVESVSEEKARLASTLAPLEEQEAGAAAGKRNGGSILFDTAQLKLPKGMIEEEGRDGSFRLEPAVVFIFLLVVAFIGFIAYLISLEPPQ
jgi:hypothetical protein